MDDREHETEHETAMRTGVVEMQSTREENYRARVAKRVGFTMLERIVLSQHCDSGSLLRIIVLSANTEKIADEQESRQILSEAQEITPGQMRILMFSVVATPDLCNRFHFWGPSEIPGFQRAPVRWPIFASAKQKTCS